MNETSTTINMTSSSVPALRMPLGWLAALGFGLLLPAFAGNSYYVHSATNVCLLAIAVIGLMIIGRVGQLSLCQAAFVGIGAYASAIATIRMGLPFALSVGLSIAIAGALSAVLGLLIMRTRGVYFVLITFAFGQVASLMFLDFEGLTGGAVGLPGVPRPRIFGWSFDSPLHYYYLVFAALAGVVIFTQLLLGSAVGRAFDSTANNLRLAESSGIPTHSTQILAFSVGSMLAALSGALSAHYNRFVAPTSYETALTVSLIVMMVLGGRLSVAGAILGAAFLVPLADLLRDARQWENIIYGLVVLVVLRFLPGGIVSAPAQLKALLERHTKRGQS